MELVGYAMNKNVKLKGNLSKANKMIKVLLMYMFSFLCFTKIYSQTYVSEDAKFALDKCQLQYSKPAGYINVNPIDIYFDVHPDYVQSSSYIALVNTENKMMIAIAMIEYPKPTNKINKYLIAKGEINSFSPKAVAAQIDTTLSKMMDVETLHLKKMNADRGIIYNIKVDGKYLGIYPRCKKIEVYKDNIARVELLFFYKENQENKVRDEIEKTWGMLRFKS